MLDTGEVLEVHTEVAAEEGQGCEEDCYEGDDGHCCVCTCTCRVRDVSDIQNRGKGVCNEPMVLNIKEDKLLADASICSSD